MAHGLIPNRYLFDFEFPLNYRLPAPTVSGTLAGWAEDDRLPRLGEIDGRPEFADVRVCWNEEGLYLVCHVGGKRSPLCCDPKRYWKSDHLRLCTDMRDTRDIKRASRYCQQFFFMPTGGGPKGNEPVAGAVKFQRAREHAPTIASGRIQIASTVRKTGYTLQAHIPADCLSGFDPAEHPRIGLYTIVEDHDLGQQYLTVGDDLYWYVDPSSWATAGLASRPPSVIA